MSDKNWFLIFLAIFGAYLTSEAPNPRRKELLKTISKKEATFVSY